MALNDALSAVLVSTSVMNPRYRGTSAGDEASKRIAVDAR